MLTVNQTDFAGLRDGTGRPFTAFVDALIRVHGYVYGVGQAEILTTLRTNVQDGGVDTQVNQAMLGDPIGFLLLPACWQYKARLNDTITESELRRDIRKEHSARLIEKGYAYRLAICDDMPAETQTDWRKLLTEEARKIDPNAPEALVITASQLAWWANCYPALLPAHFGHKTGPVMFFEAWSRSITKVTPKFVPVEGWRAAAGLIEDHMDLRKPAVSATLPLKGMAGVGKTRLVHEVALKNAGAAGLVLYAKDGDDAEKKARSLANDKRTRCLLVADDCSIQARVSIGNVLKGHTDRVRVVCIDNSGERALSGQAELELDALPPSVVQRVLEENFPHISFERRRAYAQLSGGYIRFAADMCERNAQIREHLGPIIDAVQEYYLDRFRDDAQRQIIEALSLVQKVGFGEGVSDELDALCYLTGQTREHVLEVARRLKDAPGFVVRTTRYLYITPEIIVRVAFLNAWRRWFEPDSTVYLSRFPPILLESFQSRVAQSASPEVRAQVGTFFRNSVADMEPGDLTNTDIVQKLATLIDTDPDQYFPSLVILVRQAELQELRLVNGGPANRPGSRRILVWTAERLAAFERYFPGAEEVLRKLALAETEDGIRNNAKGVWSSLFRIVLSGTEFPFRKRVELLGSLLSSTTQEVSELALLALEKTLDLESPSPMGPSVVAGAIEIGRA